MNTDLNSMRATFLKRQNVLKEFYSDPFIGYDSLEDASADCLASSQAEVMSRLLNGENLFISGPAGSGKSTIVQRFISMIDAAYNGNFNVAVTASTGLAATLIEGKTIHSWSGLGIFDGIFTPAIIKKGDPKIHLYGSWNNIKYVDVLIIDEISMLHAYYLDNLDTLFKYVRRNKKPFGGVQVVFLGDFMQLPPVPPRSPNDGVNYDYAITSQAWKDADIQYCYMDKIHRAEDKGLKHLLKSIESSKIDDAAREVIKKCLHNSRDPKKSYTTLFTTNKNVDQYNEEQLRKNPNNSIFYKFEKHVGDAKKVTKLLKTRNIPEIIELKKDATVIITSNIYAGDRELVAANGSVGRIIALNPKSVVVRLNTGEQVKVNYVTVSETKKISMKTKDGSSVEIEELVAEVAQIPLKLGYAITVHKSQGQTFDGVEVDLSNCFTPGLGYVALSRVRSSDNLIISNFTEEALKVGARSKKISIFVKKKALISRKKFLTDLDEYEGLLDNPLILDTVWDESRSGAIRKNNDKNKKKIEGK